MSEQAFKKTLAEIVDAVNHNKEVLDGIQSRDKLTLEVINNIYQRVEDMSKKFDEVLNIGLKKPRITSKNPKKQSAPKNSDNSTESKETAPPKKKSDPSSAPPVKNIMTYFKNKFIEDNKFFDDILEENQASAVFAEHKDDVEAKKEGIVRDKTKATLLYKTLSKSQKTKIREKMLDTLEKLNTNKADDIEEEVDTP